MGNQKVTLLVRPPTTSGREKPSDTASVAASILARIQVAAEARPDVACRRCMVLIPPKPDDLHAVCWRCELVSVQEAAGFYREHQGATFADFEPSIQATAAGLLVRRDAVRGLFIGGPKGTGKTRLLAAIAGAAGHARFGLARVIIRGTWNVETKDAEIRKLAECPLLLLDDIGREGKPSEDVLGLWHEILSARNGNYLPTAVTSNYTLDQLTQRYDEAIVDRFSPWRRVVMTGRSRR
jgi:hypothetical protein